MDQHEIPRLDLRRERQIHCLPHAAEIDITGAEGRISAFNAENSSRDG
jgi:hypothetical protein